MKEKVKKVKTEKAFSVERVGDQRGAKASEPRNDARERRGRSREYTFFVEPGSIPKFSFVRTFFWALALCAWAFISLELSALLVAFILRLFLSSDQLSSALWSTIYNAISYTLTLLLTVFVPCLLYRHRRPTKTSKPKPQKDTTKTPQPKPQESPIKSSIKNPFRPTRNLLGLRSLPTWIDLLLAPVGFLVYLLASSLLIALFSNFSWFDVNQAQDVGYSSYLFGSDLIIAFIALVVIAPIAEEVIFRGWLYGHLRTRLNFPVAALIVSLLFGALHGQWNVAVNVFALSLVLCSLREITGTIYAGTVLHILKNGVAFYLLYVLHTSY